MNEGASGGRSAEKAFLALVALIAIRTRLFTASLCCILVQPVSGRMMSPKSYGSCTGEVSIRLGCKAL